MNRHFYKNALLLIAFLMVIGHDFVPHRHVHDHAVGTQEHHHDHDEPASEDDDLTDLFTHFHGVGQEQNTYLVNYKVTECPAVLPGFSAGRSFSLFGFSQKQVEFVYTQSKAPPPPFGSRQLRAPPFLYS